MSLEEECLASPALRTVHTATSVNTVTSDSPLNFPHCVRGRGRPKEKRQGSPRKKVEKRKAPEKDTGTLSLVPEALRQYLIVPLTKKWGKPAGSKKKARTHKCSSRDLADPQFDSQFYDQEDVCNVCGFQLNQPTKADKTVITCNICARLVHKPCMEKKSCVCQR